MLVILKKFKTLENPEMKQMALKKFVLVILFYLLLMHDSFGL